MRANTDLFTGFLDFSPQKDLRIINYANEDIKTSISRVST